MTAQRIKHFVHGGELARGLTQIVRRPLENPRN